MFGEADKLRGHRVVVRTAGIFCTDGDVLLGAGQIVPHGSHVDGKELVNVGRDVRSPVADFLVSGQNDFNGAGRFDQLVL
ncbi:hypothetical protein D3C79_1008410 [compost metagenome]